MNNINKMPNKRYAELLRWRYLEENVKEPSKLNPWITVAYKMDLANERVAITLHGRALEEFEKIISC